jgi:hypothetical protein
MNSQNNIEKLSKINERVKKYFDKASKTGIQKQM